MLEMSPWGAGYKDFCIFVFSPFRKIFRCFNFLGGYWIFWWPRLDSLKDGIMFAEIGVANGRTETPFKKNTFFFLPFLPRWVNEEYRANASRAFPDFRFEKVDQVFQRIRPET